LLARHVKIETVAVPPIALKDWAIGGHLVLCVALGCAAALVGYVIVWHRAIKTMKPEFRKLLDSHHP
jgi:hypothetical protein